MTKFNLTNHIADRKYSELVYAFKDLTLIREAGTRGAPKKTIVEDGKVWNLVEIKKYAPVSTPRPAKVAPPAKVEIRRTEGTGPVKGTELVYGDGTVVMSEGGRPRLFNADGSPLVEIRTVTVAKVKGKKGRSSIPVEEVRVMSNPRIEYIYGGVPELRKAGRGAPRKVNEAGKTLEKIVKYILSEDAPAPASAPEEDNRPTMDELGWKVGQTVTLKGSDKVATVVTVRDYSVGVQYPGDKFIDTFPVNRLVRL